MKSFKPLLFTLLLGLLFVIACNSQANQEDQFQPESIELSVDDAQIITANSELPLNTLETGQENWGDEITYISRDVTSLGLSTTPVSYNGPQTTIQAGDEISIPGPEEEPNLTDYLDWYYALYGGLVMVFGSILNMFGLKNRLPKYKFVFAIISAGIVIGSGFIWFGFDFMTLAITLFTSMGIFDFLKGFKKAKPGQK